MLGMLGMWDIWNVECWQCEMLRMWDVGDARCGMFKDVECLGCGMFGKWDVRCWFTKCPNGFYDVFMSINLNDIAILNIQGADYRCIFTELAKVTPYMYCQMLIWLANNEYYKNKKIKKVLLTHIKWVKIL